MDPTIQYQIVMLKMKVVVIQPNLSNHVCFNYFINVNGLIINAAHLKIKTKVVLKKAMSQEKSAMRINMNFVHFNMININAIKVIQLNVMKVNQTCNVAE